MFEEKHSSFHQAHLRPHQDHRDKETRITDKLKQYADNPAFVVGELGHLRNFNKMRGTSNASLVETAAAIKKCYEELASFGVRTALTQIIPDKNPDTIFSIVKNVHDVDVQNGDDHATEEYERTLAGLLSYLESKKESPALFLTDIVRPVQYVYGTVEGDPTPHLYLIDFDPVAANEMDIYPEVMAPALKNFVPMKLRRDGYMDLVQRIDRLKAV